ncbi:MAG: dihydroorotase family protein, partial [Nitrospinota bacterium]
MKADLLIADAQVVTPQVSYPAHIYIQGGKILAISRERDLPADRVIDAAGRPVLPGAVDEHVHMMDPGYTDREDWTTGTQAAARGGVTTVIDHHRSKPQVFNRKLLEEKTEYARRRSVVDFGQLGGLDPENLEHLRPMWEGGALGFKGFLCELHGARELSEGVLLDILEEVAGFGGTVMLHCESDTILKKAKERVEAEGRKDYLSFAALRRPEAEVVATEDVIHLAELTGCRVLVAHVSQPRLLRHIRQARAHRRVPIYAESCPQYFYLDTGHLKEKGPFVKFTPPVREPETRQGMRKALAEGLVDTIGTDHCPYPRAAKEKGLGDIHQAPFGIPGIETTLRLMLNAVNEGWLTLNQLVQMMCETPARTFNIYPQKGALLPGSDADLVIVDLDRQETISDSAIVSKCGWSPYDGWRLKGGPVLTMVRGEVVAEEGKAVGDPGFGESVFRAE